MSKEQPAKNQPVELDQQQLEIYQAELLERVNKEGELIKELLENPPQHILLHVYGVEKRAVKQAVSQSEEAQAETSSPQTEIWQPNLEGRYAVRALMELVCKIQTEKPHYQPVILIAGDHAYAADEIPVSTVYADYLSKKAQANKVGGIRIIDENLYLIGLPSAQPAVETRGEVMFLKRYLADNNIKEGSVLSIGRIEHNLRISKLQQANNVKADNLSIEGILAYFHPAVVERFISRFAEIIESEHNFSEAEKKKLKLMLFDKKGILLELLARFAGPLKPLLFKVMGQKAV